MEYFIHSPATRETIRISLEFNDRTFGKIVEEFINKQFKIIPATIQIAHVHPKDTYNHSVGRTVAKNAPERVCLYKIQSISITDEKTVIKLSAGFIPFPIYENLYLTQYRKSGKVIIQHER